MAKKSPSRLESFGHALTGMASAFKSEPNLKIHFMALVATAGTGWYFGISPGEWIAVVLASGLVITAEIFNTSIETLTDLVSPNHHELARKTKDLAAAAVLIASIAAATTGLVIFSPKVSSLVLALEAGSNRSR